MTEALARLNGLASAAEFGAIATGMRSRRTGSQDATRTTGSAHAEREICEDGRSGCYRYTDQVSSR
jgi:hypothetical protein